MTDFNFDAFRPVRSADIEKKMAQIAQASELKQAALAAKAGAAAAPEDKSWSGQLGLEGGSFLGNRVNDVASLVSGTSRMAGDILSLPANALASLESNPQYAAKLRSQAKTARDTFDLSSIVDQTNRNELSADLGADFENQWGKVKSGWKDGKPSQVVSGIAGLLMNAGEAVVTNPSATREYIIENAPQLLTGEFGVAGKAVMAASNIGYAADNYRTGLEEYAKQHNGALPPTEERTRMALLSASLAAAEHGGDMFQHAVGGLGKIAKTAETAAEGATDTSASAVKNGLLQSLKRTGIAAAEGGAEETATEGYQTWAEDSINQKEISARNIFEGAVVGGVSGAGLSGGMHGVAETLKATPEHVAERQETAAKEADTQAKVDQAVDTGDHKVFLDPSTPDYNPAKAAAVLAEVSKKEDTTPEQIQDNLKETGKIVGDLESRKELIEKNLAVATPENIDKIKANIAANEEDLKDPLVDDNMRKEILADQAKMQDQLLDMTDKNRILQRQNNLSEVNRQLEDARRSHEDVLRMANPTPNESEVNDHIKNADSSDTAVASKAGDVLLNLSMTAPDTLDPSTVKNLANNKDNGLTQTQRVQLRKFAAARVAEQAVKGQSEVSQEILFGSKKTGGNIGIAQYRQRIAAAVASDSKESAERNLNMLGDFAQSHEDKLNAIAKADVGDQIVRQGDQWVVNTGKRLNDRQRAENGAFNVHENSGKKIAEIRNEVKALKAAHAQLKDVVATHFGNAVVQSVSPAAQSPAQNISSKKTGEATPRLNDKPVQTVAATPLESSKLEENTAPEALPTDNTTTVDPLYPKAVEHVRQFPEVGPKTIQDHLNVGHNRAARILERMQAEGMVSAPVDDRLTRTVTAASPQSTPASPIAANAAQATASQSATAANSNVQTVNTSQERVQETAKNEQVQPEAAKQQAAVSEANPAPVAEAATVEDTNTKQDQTTDEAPTLANAGQLSVMASRVETKPDVKLGDLFKNPDLNLVAQFFKQKAKIEMTGGHRPLIAVRDFLSAWLGKKIVTPTDFIQFDADPDKADKQKAALRHFAKLARVWNGVLAENLADYGKDDGFKLRDMMQYMLTKNGDKVSVDENVLTAMSYGMYHWLVNESNSTGKTAEQLNQMHGRDKDASYSYEVDNLLDGVANIEDTAAADLGQMAIQALGLTVGQDAPKDLMPKLQAALGGRMLIALASDKVGLVERRPINTKMINELFAPLADQKIDPKANTMYAFVDREKLAEYREANKGTGGIIDTLFGSERTPVIASTKPAKFRQEFAQHTQQKVPAKLAKVLNDAQKVPHTVIPDMWSLMGAIGRDGVIKVAGGKDIETDFVHEVNKKGVEAKKRGLENQLDLALDMLNANDVGDIHADITTPRYVQYEVWKNFRVGVITESLNQQASKIHRYMFARPSWTQKIDVNNDEHRLALEVAIAAALGIKTDNQPNVETSALLSEMYAKDADLRTVVESVHNGLNANQWANADLIAKYAAGKEGMQTLQALVAYAQLMHDPQSMATKGVTMLVGADGKTNGPILTQLALGAAPDSNDLMERMARGGIYGSAENQPKHYSQWRKDNNGKDLYQDLASYLLRVVQSNRIKDEHYQGAKADFYNDPKNANKDFSVHTPAMFNAMEKIIGSLQDATGEVSKEGRDLVKTPLTAFAFGSSLMGSIKAMENKFIDSIYTKMEKLAKAEHAGQPADVKGFVEAMNTLIRSQDPSFNDMEVDRAASMLNHALDAQVEDHLRAAFREVMGSSVKTAMESYFATFIQRRGDLNRTVQAGFAMYQAAYKAAREKAMQELMASGEIPSREKTGGTKEEKARMAVLKAEGKPVLVPRTELTPAQENAVREKMTGMLPITHTAYSMGGDLSSGMYMAKQDAQLSSNPLLQSQLQLKNDVITGKKNEDGSFSGSKELKLKGMDRIEVSPGVAGTPYLIHSLDSFLMHTALADIQESLNVHDEIGHGVLEVAKAAGAINRATVNALAKFSPAREALNMVERIATDLAARIEAGEASKEEVTAIVNDWKEMYGARIGMYKNERQDLSVKTAVEGIRTMALSNAIEADRVRLSTIAKMGVVDQYTWESGQYVVPKQVREQALKDVGNVVTEMTPEAVAAFETISKFASDEKTEVTPMEDADAAPKMETKGADMAAVAAIVGKPDTAEKIEKTAQMMASLDGTGLTPFGELSRGATLTNNAIQQAFNAKPVLPANEAIKLLIDNATGANKLIAQELKKVLPADLKVQMVSSNTATTDVIEVPSSEVHGWYNETTDGKKVVYLKGAEFLNHGMTVESMLHEMVHAAVAMEIAAPSSASSESIVKDLNALMDHLKTQPGAEKFDAIFNSKDALQEMVAWGMSNADFQKFLSGVNYTESKTARNKLVKAMKVFTTALSKLFFGNSNDTKDRALTVLMNNVSGLLEQSRGDRAKRMELMLTHATPAQSYSTSEIYEALGQNAVNPLSPEDDARLRGIMAGMIETFSPIYGAFGQQAMTGTLNATSIWANAQASGIAPFALDAVAYGLAGNEQVAFMLEQVEATMRAALSGPDGVTSVAYKEMTKLYEEAREQLKGKLPDFQYDFLFDVKGDVNDRSEYLSRFAALGLVNPDINKLLQFKTKLKNDEKFEDTLLGRMNQVLQEVMQWVVGRWTKTRMGENADSKLDTLATQMVMIEAKRRARLNIESSATLGAIESSLNSVAKSVRNKVAEASESKFFKDAKSGYVRMLGSITSSVVGERLDAVAQAYQDFSDEHFHYSNGMFANTINEIRGSHAGNRVFYHLLRMAKLFEGKRKDLIAGTTKVVKESFIDSGKYLTDDMKKAITNVFLRSDMASLMSRYSDMKDLHGLLSDNSKLAQAIVDVTGELASAKHQMYYINAAKALGYQMMSGKARVANAAQNAYSIARLYGTQTASPQESEAAAVEPIIDHLASLYALHYSSEDERTSAAEVMAKEMDREDGGNGIEMVLKLHQRLQADSKERLFKDQEALMMKGYTPEVYNPYIETRLATKEELEELHDQGFGGGAKVAVAKADPEKGAKYLMARHGSGLQPYQTGSMSLTSMNTKGTTKHDGTLDFFSDRGQYNITMMAQINRELANDVQRMFTHPIEPDAVKEEYLVPVLNPQGEKVNYRYMMSNNVKDTVLERDNRFDTLMGMMAGGIYDKEGTPKQNKQVIEALREQYSKEFNARPRSFIEVGPRSADPEMREIYRLLPQSAKDTIRDVWKSDTMHVRIDLLDVTFGYRKLSITDVLNKDRDARKGWEKLAGDVLGFLGTGKMLSEHADEEDFKARDARAMVRLRTVEDMWQWLVKEAKDIVVVKNLSTLMGNMTSNISMLYGFGVPLTEILRHHRIAFRGAVAYKRDSGELFALQTKLDTGTSGSAAETAEMNVRIGKLKDALARNPVHELIQAGLMPTIVDDVELDDDIYSFQSKANERVEKMTSWINEDLKKASEYLYMGHDTIVYQVLADAAQISDFLGRYTLYQHMTTKKKDPMSKKEAIELASDAFINYDVPTDRRTQYLNDMGFVRFTKYYLRIQKIILALHRGNPGRALGLVALSHYFKHLPTVMDSSFYHRIGNNPLEAGVFTYPQAIGTLASYKALTLPFH